MSDLVRTQPTLTLEGAQRVLRAATTEAERLLVAACIAISDHSGQLLSFTRMDGAPLLSAGLAQDKAWTVASFSGVPTQDWYPMIRDEPALLHGIVHTDRLVIFGGGVPVRVDGQLVGAIGVSGGSADQDQRVALAGAAATG